MKEESGILRWSNSFVCVKWNIKHVKISLKLRNNVKREWNGPDRKFQRNLNLEYVKSSNIKWDCASGTRPVTQYLHTDRTSSLIILFAMTQRSLLRAYHWENSACPTIDRSRKEGNAAKRVFVVICHGRSPFIRTSFIVELRLRKLYSLEYSNELYSIEHYSNLYRLDLLTSIWTFIGGLVLHELFVVLYTNLYKRNSKGVLIIVIHIDIRRRNIETVATKSDLF